MMIALFLLCLFCESTKGDASAICGGNVILRCPAKAGLDRVNYRAISWYRVSEEHLSGIIRWDRRTNTVRRFANLTQVVECPSGDGLTLELQNLTTGDGGIYRCSLWAPVGQQNRQGDIQLSVTGCSDVVESYRDEAFLLCGVAAVLLLCTLMLLYIHRLEKLSCTRRKCINPTVEAFVHIAPFVKKPYELMTERV